MLPDSAKNLKNASAMPTKHQIIWSGGTGGRSPREWLRLANIADLNARQVSARGNERLH
jgi:hypothetical protein